LSRFLAFLLSRAVPEARVEQVKIACWTVKRSAYFIVVHPYHTEYWLYFHKRYPQYKRLALKHGAGRHSLEYCCPEFPTRGDLIDWLSDVLSLSPGERNLLRLVEVR